MKRYEYAEIGIASFFRCTNKETINEVIEEVNRIQPGAKLEPTENGWALRAAKVKDDWYVKWLIFVKLCHSGWEPLDSSHLRLEVEE